MIPKRKLLFASVVLMIIFTLTTYSLIKNLIGIESEVRIENSIEDEIYQSLKNLPNLYKIRPESTKRIDFLLEQLKQPQQIIKIEDLWKLAKKWPSKKGVLDLKSPYLNNILHALSEIKVIKADLDTRGTQLKFLLTLEGSQEVVFKPQWYNLNRTIDGPVYAGKDRYNSEIIAFYLSILLNMPFVPPSAPRNISFTQEMLPVATKRLLETSFAHHNKTCVYGKCFYCKKEDPICEEHNQTIFGAAIYNIDAKPTGMRSFRSPWQRSYKKGKMAAWESASATYCAWVRSKIPKKRLLDLIDAAIFDFIIQNGDRHHYETMLDNVILLDNGKGLGNPNVHFLDILAPLYQCCTLRGSTLRNLQALSGGVLVEKLQQFPKINNLITTYHLKAMEERLLLIFATVEYCRKKQEIL